MVKSSWNEDEDEFWSIALGTLPSFTEDVHPSSVHQRRQKLEDDDDNDNESESSTCSNDRTASSSTTTKNDKIDVLLKTYSLPLLGGITLRVSTLPQNDGIMSPLGGQAWHASVLLASYLILYKTNEVLLFNDNELNSNNNHRRHLTCLELGSGAVGLSGMTLAAILNNNINAQASSSSDVVVILTDLVTEDGILENLTRNVRRNKATTFPNVTVRVEPLDWMDYYTTGANNKNSSDKNDIVPVLPPLDLVIGSELVYTHETAAACAAVVTRLLYDNPNLVVLIVQVMDRPGFETHFLPTLFRNNDFIVRIEQPLDVTVHEVASRIVTNVGDVMGGTLDRFDFGACWIRRRTTTTQRRRHDECTG